jgi:hypothetical protein
MLPNINGGKLPLKEEQWERKSYVSPKLQAANSIKLILFTAVARETQDNRPVELLEDHFQKFVLRNF